MDSRRSKRGLYELLAAPCCAAQFLPNMSTTIAKVAERRPILSRLTARMKVFPVSKVLILACYRVPKAAFGRQRFYTLRQHSASCQFKIFRLSGGLEHGIVSPPGNRDTTEFQQL